MIQKKKSLFFLVSVVLLIGLLFCGQPYAQSGSKITPRLLELYKQKLKGASAAPAYGENSKVYVLFTAATNTGAVDFSFFNERKIEYIKSEHYIEAVIDAELIPELDSIAGIAEIDISIQATPAASAGNALMNVTDYNNSGFKGAGVKIGIVDIQYDGYQNRLSNSVITADFRTAGNPPIANSGTGGTHGTTCAGIVYDIVPEAQMYIARISGVVQMENAYEWCFKNGVKIISISLNMGSSQANTIVNNYTDKGILTVAAAGNSGPGKNTIIPPATQEKVLTAGSIAIDTNNGANWTNGTVANMSSRGPGENGCMKPDLLTPSSTGATSWAAPHAAGAAAILLSVADKSLCDTPAKLKALVVSFARPIGNAPDNNYGYGKLVLPNYSDFAGLVNGTSTISTITPTESRRGTNNVSITINGTNFLAGSTVKLIKGSGTITANSVTYNSSSRLTATFNIPSTALAGYYTVAVSSSGYAGDITKPGILFLVLSNTMAINNAAPDVGIIGTTLRLTATGTGFLSGAAIKLISGGTVINSVGITQSETTGITASFAIPSSVANNTKFDLTVTNPSGDYVTKTQAVTAYDALKLTSFSPSNVTVGSAVSLTVTGTGFINGHSRIILKNASNTSQTITPSTTSVSATQITGTFTAPESTGTWKVYVSAYNGGPEYAAVSNLSITVLPFRIIDSITPTESKRGTNNVSITINGANFLAGSTAKLIKGTATITAASVTYNSSSRLTAIFNIPSTAIVGYYNLAVSSSGYGSDIPKTGIFLVLGNSMAINNATPDIGIIGTTLNLTAAGTDFQNAAAIKLVNGSTVINGIGITRSETTGITASFAIPSSVTDGTKFDLTVTNLSGDYVTKTQAVTAYNALTVTSFTPSNAAAASAVSLTVNGTGFKSGYSKIILKNAANESQTITPSTTSVSATQITGTFTAPSSSGTWKVYVSAYNGGPEYAASSNLSITALSAGTISTITPTESRRGTNNVSITINGTNFLAGSTVKLIKGTATITANSVTYNSSSRLTAAFNIPGAAAVGYYDLAVSSSGYAGDITKPGIFLVLGNSMAINNVVPDIGIRGTTLNLTATGTDFQSGATIRLVNGSTVINGTGVTRSGTTGITAAFALPSTIANGTKFDLTVTNTSGDYVTKPQAVIVYNALTVTGFTPLSSNTGSVLITVTGTGFINGYSKIILKNALDANQTITPNITSASAAQIVGTFTATSSGTWKVYVRAYDNGPEYAAAGSMTIAASTAHNLFAYEGAEITFPVISRDGAVSTGKMIIPERTFSEDVTVDAKQHGSLAPAESYVRELQHTNIGVIVDAQGKKPEREIELRIPYNNSDITGMNEESLVISRYDEEKQVWIPLKSKADSNSKQIIAKLDHLSVFAIMGTSNTVKAFENMKYYPNPLQPSKGLNYSRMQFSNIPAGTRIKIYTLLGQIVRELEADASGMAVWDGRNNAGEKAASGVYIVYMEDGSGNKKRIKVAVER